ncbi:hypothetical protein STRATTON_134 [Erwinia phage vB_EamM_Stratton]|uniref:Uncharacterized protein n=1 Tax=Erwinia phage vB_EamM_Stratton TaxID=1883378 RepID=A0A1B2IH26_9CAUD|nr:hypothetical protein STRATTON_134 [Erwinia phage vB_EamM_Stratton]
MFLKRIKALFKKEKTTTDFSPIDQAIKDFIHTGATWDEIQQLARHMNFGSVFDMWLYVEDAGLRSELRVRCDPDTRKRIEDYWHQEIHGKQPVALIVSNTRTNFDNLEMLTRWLWDSVMSRYPMQKVRFGAEHVSRRPNRVSLKIITHGSTVPVDVAFIEGLTKSQVKRLMESYPV